MGEKLHCPQTEDQIEFLAAAIFLNILANQSSFKVFISLVDDDGNRINGLPDIEIIMHRVSANDSKGSYAYYSMTNNVTAPGTKGKPVIFINDENYHGAVSDVAYYLYFEEDANIKWRINDDEF